MKNFGPDGRSKSQSTTMPVRHLGFQESWKRSIMEATSGQARSVDYIWNWGPRAWLWKITENSRELNGGTAGQCLGEV